MVGAPHTRLLSLMRGEAEAAALISPYSEIATGWVFKKVFETNTVDVLAFIAKTDLSEKQTTVLLRVLNEAIRMVKKIPKMFRPTLSEGSEGNVEGLSTKVRAQALAATKKLSKQLPVVPVERTRSLCKGNL